VKSTGVLIWWAGISAAGLVNVAIWLVFRARLRRDQVRDALWQQQHLQLVLAGIYVFVCASRSFIPRADVQKITLVDSWFATVLVGRTIATVAELCFMAQVAATLANVARHLGHRGVLAASRAIIPMIAVAEVCSWYAVVTTNFLGNACEESLWTLSGLVTAISLGLLALRAKGGLRVFLVVGVALGMCQVIFMSTVDVPMYVTRWLADQAAARPYLGLADGFHELATKWVVTFAWEDWHDELAWMALYFSAGVWMSLYLVQAPRLWNHRAKG
jgi:hypothetical protein